MQFHRDQFTLLFVYMHIAHTDTCSIYIWLSFYLYIYPSIYDKCNELMTNEISDLQSGL